MNTPSARGAIYGHHGLTPNTSSGASGAIHNSSSSSSICRTGTTLQNEDDVFSAGTEIQIVRSYIYVDAYTIGGGLLVCNSMLVVV